MDNVVIRFFTDPSFHAKFYIVDQSALVGSANLTLAGMRQNREVSVIIGSDDPRFEELPGIFDELWSAASPLTQVVVDRFEAWRRSNNVQISPPISGVDAIGPRTVDISSQHVSKERSYLQSFRALYEESILPAHEQVRSLYFSSGERHPFFRDFRETYELDRFLFWAAGEIKTKDVDDAPLRSGDALAAHVEARRQRWMSVEPEEVYHSESELERYDKLMSLAQMPNKLASMNMSEVTQLMSACNAFRERLRFTKGGLAPLLKAFEKRNSSEHVAKMLQHLVNGDGDYAQRNYDCIFDPQYKLQEWGRNSTLELFGWINNEGIPPVNGRTTKALRILGLDVPLF